MKKGKAQKDIFYIAISSLVLAVLWVGFSIYHAYVDSTITPALQTQIEPIEPIFNTQVIQELKSRRGVIPVFELESLPAESASSEAGLQPDTETQPASTNSGIPTESGGFIEVQGA